MKETVSLEQEAKTPYTIQNKPTNTLVSAHDYVIEKYMEKHFNTKK